MSITLKPLRDQTVVIIGASSGIGLATAKRAAREGAAVVLAARNAEALERVRNTISSAGGRALVCVADAAEPDDLERVARDAAERFGGFDSWVNDAAAATYGRMEEVPLEDHRRIFDVNYHGVLAGSLIAARYLRERGGGAIINMGSVLSDRAMIYQGAYSASKAAVQSATDALRMELEHEQAPISVTLIKPGAINTPYPEHARNYLAGPPRLPAPLYDPELVAEAILFACQTPRRQIYVGGGGLAVSLAGKFAPRLTDLAMEAFGARVQQKDDDPGVPQRRDNLYEPKEDGAIRGAQDVWVRRTSLLLQAQTRPMLLPLAMAATGAAMLQHVSRQMRRSRAHSG